MSEQVTFSGHNVAPDDWTDAQRFDRFARFYDGDYRAYDEDVEALTGLALDCGNPVLELGCGTGRLLLPLALAGCQVTGVDISPGLLDVARTKVAAAQMGRRVRLEEGDLRTFDLGQKNFAFAFCTSNTLMHLADSADQMAALKNAHTHLRAGGLLLLDLFNPDVNRLATVSGLQELADQWYDPLHKVTVTKWSVRTVDWAEQLQETLFIYEETGDDGWTRRTLCPFLLRFLWPHELEMMLASAGFTVEVMWGDFVGTPFSSDAEHLIVLATKS